MDMDVMDITETERTELLKMVDATRPEAEACAARCLADIAHLPDLTQKLALLTLQATWLAEVMERNEQEALRLMKQFNSDLPEFIKGYCGSVRHRAN